MTAPRYKRSPRSSVRGAGLGDQDLLQASRLTVKAG